MKLQIMLAIGRRIIRLAELLYLYIRYDQWTIAAYFRTKGAHVGDNCMFHIRSLGDEPYLVNIGDNVFVAREVIFHTHDGGAWIANREVPGIYFFGTIVLEDNCLIGARSQLLPNVRIGRNSIVAANSVVISDVPPNSIVMGVPARVIGSSEKYKAKCLEKWKEQQPPGYQHIKPCDFWTYKEYLKNRQILRQHLERLFETNTPH